LLHPNKKENCSEEQFFFLRCYTTVIFPPTANAIGREKVAVNNLWIIANNTFVAYLLTFSNLLLHIWLSPNEWLLL
jgi:hypothetical protein